LKKRLFIAFAVATVCVVAILIATWRDSAGFYYQGKSFRDWSQGSLLQDKQTERVMKVLGTKAVPGLVQLLQAKDSVLRKRAWTYFPSLPLKVRQLAWARIGPPNSVSTREAAARSLGLIGPEAKAAVPFLIDALRDKEGRVGWEAAAALARIGQDAVPDLARALEDQSPTVRRLAAYALGEAGPAAQAAVPLLIHSLGDTNDEVRVSVACSLTRIGTPGLLELTDLLEHGDTKARQAAAKALLDSYLSLRDAVPALVDMAHDQSPAARQQALETLSTVRAIDALSMHTLMGALSDPSVEVRVAAIKGLGLMGFRAFQAVPKLIESLKDQSPAIREWSARALGYIGPGAMDAVPELTRLRADPEPKVRTAAEQALAKIHHEKRAE
jgi:HEAT repeat protein